MLVHSILVSAALILATSVFTNQILAILVLTTQIATTTSLTTINISCQAPTNPILTTLAPTSLAQPVLLTEMQLVLI